MEVVQLTSLRLQRLAENRSSRTLTITQSYIWVECGSLSMGPQCDSHGTVPDWRASCEMSRSVRSTASRALWIEEAADESLLASTSGFCCQAAWDGVTTTGLSMCSAKLCPFHTQAGSKRQQLSNSQALASRHFSGLTLLAEAVSQSSHVAAAPASELGTSPR